MFLLNYFFSKRRGIAPKTPVEHVIAIVDGHVVWAQARDVCGFKKPQPPLSSSVVFPCLRSLCPVNSVVFCFLLRLTYAAGRFRILPSSVVPWYNADMSSTT